MSRPRSENEMATAGVILFAIGVGLFSSLGVLPIFSTPQFFLLGFTAGLLMATGIVLILRSVKTKAAGQ